MMVLIEQGTAMKEVFVPVINERASYISLLVLCIFLGISCYSIDNVYAIAPYGKAKTIFVKNSNLSVIHSHDWQNGLRESSLKIQRHKQKKIVLASPPLRSVVITNDAKYIIGLSEVTFDNLYQLVVWSANGKILNKTKISCLDSKFSNLLCYETSDGNIYWYDVENPIKNVVKRDEFLDIELRETKPPYCYYGYFYKNCERPQGIFLIQINLQKKKMVKPKWHLDKQ